MRSNLIITAVVTLLVSCISPKETAQGLNSNQTNITNYTIGFYNVENLFDTENDPSINDDEFTENGEKEWNQERYNDKLNKISEVIGAIPANGLPIAFGLCEVENGKVVADLIKADGLKSGNYDLVHYDSQDERGIDNAFIYRKDILKVISSKAISPDITIDGVEDQTRDILYIKTAFKKSNQEVHFFVNHFPSRGGGQEKSEPKRLAVAKVLTEAIAEIRFIDENAAIIIVGDFNDMPDNRSMREVLGACPVFEDCYLSNLSYPFHINKQGTYNYRGEWNVLDQIIVSKPLTDSSNNLYIKDNEAKIMNAAFVMYTSEDGTTTPNRTYGGKNYYGGFSDHLATYSILSIKN